MHVTLIYWVPAVWSIAVALCAVVAYRLATARQTKRLLTVIIFCAACLQLLLSYCLRCDGQTKSSYVSSLCRVKVRVRVLTVSPGSWLIKP